MTKERSESSDVRKWANDRSTASVRSGSSIFYEFDDTETSFQRGSSHLYAGREKEGIDEVFQALLKEANRELAGLLKDVRSKSEGIPFDGSDRQVLHTLLMRAVRCAMKQHMLQAELGNLALTDELTGVYNRRGFQVVAERQLKLA